MRAGAECCLRKSCVRIYFSVVIFDYTRLGKLEVNKWQRTANENAAGIRRIRYSLILRLVALYWEVIYVFCYVSV